MNTANNSTIGLFYCGGFNPAVNSTNTLLQELRHFDEIDLLADVQPAYMPSARPDAEETTLQRVALEVKKQWNTYDGFVVVFDQENFVYDADLLAYMLGPIGKPVVCIGVHASIEDSSSIANTRYALMNAVQVARADFSGTAIIVGNAVMPATHVEIVEGRVHTYVSADKIIYATVNFGVQLSKHAPRRSSEVPVLQLDYEQRVQHIYELEEGQTITAPSIVEHVSSLTVEQLQELALAPTLVITDGVVLLLEDNQLQQITGLTEQSAAAKFVWSLGQMQRADLAKREKKRTLIEWMQMPMVNEFLMDAS